MLYIYIKYITLGNILMLYINKKILVIPKKDLRGCSSKN